MVIASQWDARRHVELLKLPPENIFVQPAYRGTAYEVLLALVRVGERVAPDTPIVFLPSDHVVSDEEIMTSSLLSMVDWVKRYPERVYLLGAVPEGPHDQLGYIVPWYDAMNMASDIYEFVEAPDVKQARNLINAGGLWNTFIFGGTCATLLALYRPRFDAVIDALRAAGKAPPDHVDGTSLKSTYDRLKPMDFSRDVLTPQLPKLSVLRMPRCGWWPLKSPARQNSLGDDAHSEVVPFDGRKPPELR